ncbi:helix-turn-helix domain-containing protein [Thalassospira xiamenensis]|uniref:helix-turn-helix domain-containing protein n=1 Tax=Thalassospira xiamenensis TaxID=220697 RepID=UPI000E80E71C|nr:helix-turn-helix domain-containing protein [Thalassospira xiamenensis]HBN50492.1 DNA-binding protein [Thalassospira sp.]
MVTGQFQTVKDVADMLKVGEATVRRWIKDGALRAIDVGRGWRIAPEDFDDFLRQHANRPHSHSERDTEAVDRQAPDVTGASKCSTTDRGKVD